MYKEALRELFEWTKMSGEQGLGRSQTASQSQYQEKEGDLFLMRPLAHSHGPRPPTAASIAQVHSFPVMLLGRASLCHLLLQPGHSKISLIAMKNSRLCACFLPLKVKSPRSERLTNHA